MTTKPTTIIISGFSLVILLVLSLLAISLYQLNLTKQTLNNNILLEAKHAAIASNLQNISHSRSGIIASILFETDVFVKDEMIQNLYQLGEDFMLKRAILLDTELGDFEKKILDQHMATSQVIVSIQHNIVSFSLENNHEQAHHLFMHKSLPIQQKNSQLLDKLSQYQNDEIQVNISHLNEHLNTSFLLMLTAGVFIILFCIIIAIFIYRRLTRNINDLKNTHTALTDSLSSLKNIEHALDEHAIVSIADVAGEITYVNEKFCQISQYSEKELLGSNHNVINSGFHSKSYFRNMMTTIYSGATWQGKIRNRKKDGTYYWVATTIVPFLDKNHTPYQYIAIRTDITTLKKTENELATSLQQLAKETDKALESNAVKESIISTMTHELKTPLNSILGFSQLLQLNEDSLTEMQIDNINNIIESGKELLQNIDNIMLYSKLKSNTINLQNTPIDLDLLIQSSIDEVQSRGFSSAVVPTLETSNSLEFTADMTLMRKAFYYLIDNAIKFTARGSIKIHVSHLEKGSTLPEQDTLTDDKLILITIQDTGIGIPADKLEIIFDEFRQVEEKDNRQFEGIGIGLSLSKSIINLHKGEIWLASTLNVGTTVYITLPL